MDFEAQWRKVNEKEALLLAEQRRNLQRDIAAEFEKMKSRVEKNQSGFDSQRRQRYRS